MGRGWRYLWAKNVVLLEMERDGLLRPAERAAMSAQACEAANVAHGAEILDRDRADDGYGAAAAVFARLALGPNRATAYSGAWAEAARRAIAKSFGGGGPGRALPAQARVQLPEAARTGSR